MLYLDDPLLVVRAAAAEYTADGAPELSASWDALPLGLVGVPAVTRTDDRRLDAHDIVCFLSWSLIITRDVVMQPHVSANVIRPFGPETTRTLERNHEHWKREHRPAPQLPETWI